MTQIGSQTGTHVATLIAGPSAVLETAEVERVRAALPHPAPAVWLAEHIAAEIAFTANAAGDQSGLSARLRGLAGENIDVVVQPAVERRKKLFLADMDSTMIGQECIDELADFAGLKQHIAAITECAMRGEIEFEPALRERVALLKDLPVSAIDEVLAKRIALMPGARTLIATMRANGALTCLVSGGFTLFTDRIARMIGFDESRANRLVTDGGRLTGAVAEPIFGRDGKRSVLIELRNRLGLAREQTLATGDGANDIAMIEAAGLGVAFHAKPKVAVVAPARIDHGDLTALLYLQGYRNDEFVES